MDLLKLKLNQTSALVLPAIFFLQSITDKERLMKKSICLEISNILAENSFGYLFACRTEKILNHILANFKHLTLRNMIGIFRTSSFPSM